MRRLRLLLVFFLIIFSIHTYLSGRLFGGERSASFSQSDERTQKIIKQEKLIAEGNALVVAGRYLEAISKFKEAEAPLLLNNEWDKGRATYFIEKVYKLQGKYKEALDELQWAINLNPQGNGWVDEKFELEALIKARDTNSAQPIYEHIAYLKKKYKNQLPPKRVIAGISEIVTSAIVRLYDHIGDCDGGGQFVETFLRYYAKRGPGNPYQPANPHFQIKQAFEADKAEGFKGCINAKPGEVCMGRAAKSIIQSDYFPW